MAGYRKRGYDKGAVTVRVSPYKKARTGDGIYRKQSYKAKTYKSKPVSGNSDTKWITLPYSGFVNNTAIASNSAATVEFKINTLDKTTTYEQHYMGANQYYTLFSKAYVKSVLANVTVSTNTSSAELHCNVYIDDNSGASTTLKQSNERCYSKGGQHRVGFFGANSFKNNLVFNVKEYTMKVFHNGFDESNNWQSDDAAPGQQLYLHIEVFNGSTALAADATGLQIEYNCQAECCFFDPKELDVGA